MSYILQVFVVYKSCIITQICTPYSQDGTLTKQNIVLSSYRSAQLFFMRPCTPPNYPGASKELKHQKMLCFWKSQFCASKHKSTMSSSYVFANLLCIYL